MKWYIACAGVSLLTGGSTPKASQVRKMTSVGCPATQGILALRMNSIGYAPRVFSVIDVSWKSTWCVVLVEDDVLQHRAEAERLEDVGLRLRRQVDRLGVAAALDVEDAAVGPAVLVVADQQPLRDRPRASSCPCPRGRTGATTAPVARSAVAEQCIDRTPRFGIR